MLGFSINLGASTNRVLMSAQVTGANTITVSRFNLSGVSVDLTSATHRFVVLPQANWGL